MVRYGFSLLDLRKLYIDELFDFYRELVFVQEKAGELKAGAYEKLTGASENTVAALRSQILKIRK